MIVRNFTNEFGQTLTDTELVILDAEKVATTADQIDHKTAYVESRVVHPLFIRYQMCYWVTPQAKVNGDLPLQFIIEAIAPEISTCGWRFDLTDEYAAMNIEQACIHHFTNYVFPVNLPAGNYTPSATPAN